MLKKILPALTLMFVLTLSFAFSPAPQQQKAEDDAIFAYVGGEWQEGDELSLVCPNSGALCAIRIENPDGGKIATAQSEAETMSLSGVSDGDPIPNATDAFVYVKGE